ncbi:MAG: S-methyl-5-thioribose-1-phosphate isomerase [Chloroflexi bacterium]|nr:S-methyl-5-thioribose-1-phosphate isomerase [Chloroflexota bacterium]
MTSPGWNCAARTGKNEGEAQLNRTTQPLEWLGDRLKILDQTRLPRQEVYLDAGDYLEVAAAIKELKVRGAPAIGVAGAYAVALGGLNARATARDDFLKEVSDIISVIAGTRPTARNLFHALERMRRAADIDGDVAGIKAALVEEAVRIHEEEAGATLELSEHGAALIPGGSKVLTHCNTGPLATTGYGTALGVIMRASETGKDIKVFATETRPLLQGARLTAWELKKAGIPVTLITDSMAGYFMAKWEIDCVIVGADRIAANGDTANKIGTYSLAVLAHEHGIPFYVAAPTTTIDPSLATGADIPIEQRQPEEVTHIQGVCIAPDCEVANPAFDVTPCRYITAIITEKGIVKPPYGEWG